MTPEDRMVVGIVLGSIASEFARWKRLKPEEERAIRVLCARYWRVHRTECYVCRSGDRCEFGAALEKFLGGASHG